MHVLIVNDSLVAVQLLKRILTSDSQFHPIATVRDGLEAMDYVARQKPDVILMDIHMPNQNGVQTTQQILKKYSIPVLIVTATVRANMQHVFDCLKFGALDAISLPKHKDFQNIQNLSPSQIKALTAGFLEKVKTIGSLELRPEIKASSPQKNLVSPATPLITFPKKPADVLIVLGASTGGPEAIIKFLTIMPPNLSASIVIVQHLDFEFIPGLIDHLKHNCVLPIEMAKNASFPISGKVYLAGKEQHHLTLSPRKKFTYVKDEKGLHTPSIDVFFQSVAKTYGSQTIGILLTGMGNDGAQGLLEIKQVGGRTIVQDEESSVIYGMPKAAINLKAAERVLPMDLIGKKTLDFLNVMD